MGPQTLMTQAPDTPQALSPRTDSPADDQTDSEQKIQQPTDPSLAKILLKSILWTSLFLVGLILVSGLVVGWWGWQQWRSFSQTSGLDLATTQQLLKTGWQQTPIQTNNHKTVLLLGTDSLDSRGDVPPLTDSILLANLDLETGQIATLPLPRDLWSQEYQTKINALYAYGFDRNPALPTEFPTQVISELTGLEIHHTVVLSLDQVATLIDLIGGIEVEVPVSFSDDTFPRPDVDITTETDPAVLYKTVSFDQGPQVMSGKRALEYIRSRKSQSDQGTDLARSQRQQDVISALVDRVRQPEVILDPTQLGELYVFYDQNFAQVLPATEILATGKALWPIRNEIALTQNALSTFDQTQDDTTLAAAANPQPVLIHPPVRPDQYLGQWVYIVPDTAAFQREVKTKLQTRTE